MPYIRYESEDAVLKGGATLREAVNFDQSSTAAEASQQKYVALPGIGSALEWNIQQPANGVTLRFTMPDAPGGGGLTGSLALFVNGQKIKDIDLTSYWAYQYFPNSDPENTPGERPRMRFDEVNFLLTSALEPGDVLRIENSAGDYEYGVDFIEIEEVEDPLPCPAGFLNVTDYGATPDDETDDLQAFHNALAAAEQAGTGIYIPAGRFVLDDLFVFEYNNVGMIGAGMWHTELYFTNMEKMSGGILARCTNVELAHFRMNTNNNRRFYVPGDYMIYKGLMGTYGYNSDIHHLWITHFECGAWIAGYDPPYPIDITTNLTFAYNRVRNNYADGINLCQGTNNTVVEQCNFRSNGDDAMAVWPNNELSAPMAVNNTFRYNTVEHNYRAAGVAIFGGMGHQIHNNLIVDGFAGSGIRLTTDFSGFHFENNTDGIFFRDNTIVRCGTSYDLWNFHRGAVEINATSAAIQNVHFENLEIIDAQRHAIQIGSNSSITNFSFDNVAINGYGKDGVTESLYTAPTGGKPVCSYGGASGTVNLNCVDVEGSTFNSAEHLYKVNNIEYIVSQDNCGEKPVEGISLNPAEGLSLAVDNAGDLEIVYTPLNTTEKAVDITVLPEGIVDVTQITPSQLRVNALSVGTAVVTVTSAVNASIFDEVTIQVMPTVNVSAPVGEAHEGGSFGTFEIVALGITEATEVNYQLSGAASADDYTASPELSGVVTLDPDNLVQEIVVNITDDDLFEGDEELTITLGNGQNYSVGIFTASIVLKDNDYPPCDVPVIVFTSEAPAISASVGAEWSMAPAMAIENVVVGTRNADYAAQWRGMYDESGLYVLTEVEDDVLQGGTGAEWWNDDVVEIYIDGDNSKNSSYDGINDFQLAFRWNDGTVKAGANSVQDVSGVEFEMWASSGGYNCLAYIPWSTIGVSPEAGSQIGFDVAVDDNDGQGRSQIAAFSTTEMAWSNPQLFGDVYLTVCNVESEIYPHADAGADQYVSVADGGASVLLDGSGSYHPDGNIVSYVWSMNGTEIATGVSPTVTLQEGEHLITLTVFDEGGRTATDQVRVFVTNSGIVRTNTPVVVDQTIEEAWTHALSKGINVESVNTRPAGFEASWRGLFDDEYLYVLVEVDGVSPVNDSPEYWNDDAVDIFVDVNNSKNQQYDGVDDYQLGFRWNDDQIHVGNNSVVVTEGVEFSVYGRAGGYVCEVALPWSMLGQSPTWGMILGFDVAVNIDGNGGERTAQMVTYGGDMNWSNPSLFGDVPLLFPTIASDNQANMVGMEELFLYPVPFSDVLTVEWTSEMSPVSVSLSDVSGRLVLKEQIPDGATMKKLSVGSLKPGIYFVVLQEASGNLIRKIVKY